jgi:hypothetical protein
MSSTIQVRVDADLFEAAKSAGADAGRSAAQQIRHWARMGREFEKSVDILAGRRETVSRTDARRDLGPDEAREELGDGNGAEHA